MLKAGLLFAIKRGWWLTMFAGLASFTASFGALIYFATDLAAAVIPASSEKIVIAVFAAIAALTSQCTTSVTNALLTRRLHWKNEKMRTALDSMTQGMSMFDATERLVVCNSQYYAMYGLTLDDVRPGSTLSEVLEKR